MVYKLLLVVPTNQSKRISNQEQQYLPTAMENVYKSNDNLKPTNNQKPTTNIYGTTMDQKQPKDQSPYVISNPYQKADQNKSPPKPLQQYRSQGDQFGMQSNTNTHQNQYQQQPQQQQQYNNNNKPNQGGGNQQNQMVPNQVQYQNTSYQQPLKYQVPMNSNTDQNYYQDYTNGNQKYQQQQQQNIFQPYESQGSAKNGKQNKDQQMKAKAQHSVDGQQYYDNNNGYPQDDDTIVYQQPPQSQGSESTKYKPYTLREYEEMKKTGNSKLGGLGPNTYTDDWCKGKGKQQKRHEFAEQVQQFNQANIAAQPTINERDRPKKDVIPNTRQRAIDFAKQIQKPPPPPRRNEERNIARPQEVPENNIEKYERQHLQYLQQLDQMK